MGIKVSYVAESALALGQEQAGWGVFNLMMVMGIYENIFSCHFQFFLSLVVYKVFNIPHRFKYKFYNH